jgi:uncharacterized protein YlxW (UPF0749 family)
MSSDRQEFGTVRNGSELPSGAGRPPVMNDEDLRRLADQLNTKLGRPPKAEELIAAAGGCQRKRALAALKALRLDLSQRAVRSGMLFPAAVEQALRAQMGTWLDLAASHLASRHLEESERVEAKLATQSALIEELQAKVRTLQEAIADREHMLNEFRVRAQAAESELVQAEAARSRAEVLAAERARLLEQLQPLIDRARQKSDG